MKKPVLIAAAAAVILATGGASYWLGHNHGSLPKTVASAPAAAKPAPGVTVEAARVARAKLAQSITAVGSLRSDESVLIRPEVAGRISEILFREGQRVARGATLVRLDASVQRAELEQAQANLTLNKSKLERALDLQKKGFISSQAREEAENTHRIAQAAHDLAFARLAKLDIKAPFAGIVGLRQVSVGDYVKDGQDIVNLEAVDPLKVDFRVPEIHLPQVAAGQTLQIALDAFPDQMFAGGVYAINPLVDANGRAIVVRAAVKNPEGRLRPGMFARVRLLFNENRESLMVPEQALIPLGDDKFVYKVVDGRAIRVKVDVGQRREGRAEILQGLAADELVVTAGQTKIRDGAAVSVAEAATPVAPANKTAERENTSTANPIASQPREKS